MSRVTKAIERSVSHTEIVTLDYDTAGYVELLEACDDRTTTEDMTEFWAYDPNKEDAMLWRVHMRHAPDDAGDRAYDEARDLELTEGSR